MNDKELRKILKKYKISESKSPNEIMEMLEIKWDELLERQNVKKDAGIMQEIEAINQAIEYLKDRALYLTEIAENQTENKKEDRSGEIQQLKETSKSNNANVSSGTSGGKNTPDNIWFTSLTGDSTINNMFIQIEDNLNYEQWAMVDRIADNILLAEPKNPSAFLAKALVNYKCKKVQELAVNTNPALDNNVNIRKAHDFGNAAQAKYMDDLLEERRCFCVYKDAYRFVGSRNATELQNAADKFESIKDYRDAAGQAANCRARAAEITRLENIQNVVKVFLYDFEKKSDTDEAGKRAVLRDLKEFLQKEPDGKQFASDEVLQNLEDKIAETHKKVKQNIKAKNSHRNANIVAGVLMAITLLFGIVGVVPAWGDNSRLSGIWRKTGILGYFPCSATAHEYSVYDTDTPYLFHLGRLERLSISNADNLKYYILPNAKLEYFQLETDQENIHLLPAETINVNASNCTSLEIPEGTKDVKISAVSLKELVLPESIENVDILYAYSLSQLTIPAGATIETLHIYDSSSLNQITILDGAKIKNIEVNECGALSKLTIQDGARVKNIDVSSCEALSELTIPEGTENVSVGGADALEELVFPESIMEISVGYCDKLNQIVIPDNANPQSINIQDCTALSQLVIPEDIKNNENVFYMKDCPLLE